MGTARRQRGGVGSEVRPCVRDYFGWPAGTTAVTHAQGMVRRSEFGLGKYVPIVSDATTITISVEFTRKAGACHSLARACGLPDSAALVHR
jgi:hypothetical protein